MEDGHSKTVDEVLSHFRVDPERGLSLDQVKEYQKKYGPNACAGLSLMAVTNQRQQHHHDDCAILLLLLLLATLGGKWRDALCGAVTGADRWYIATTRSLEIEHVCRLWRVLGVKRKDNYIPRPERV
uniref:Cation_ATPase_N domain-containing protein n=1 Tax=Anopheles melas TaxID=34690 RepID=A0A182UKJ5_9DIPT